MSQSESSVGRDRPDPEDCTSPVVHQLEMVPANVGYVLEDGELRPDGHVEDLLGRAPLEETGQWMCLRCLAEFDSREDAREHAEGGEQ